MTRRHFIEPGASGAGANFTITTLTAVSGTFTAATSTTGYGISTAAANRWIFLCLVYGTNTGDPTSVTIGGVTATLLAKGGNGGTRTAAIYVASVPTGTTATVTIGASNNGHTVAYTFFCYAVYGAVNTTPKAFNAGVSLANGTVINSQKGGVVLQCTNQGGAYDSALTVDNTTNNTAGGQNLLSCSFGHSVPAGLTTTVGDNGAGSAYAYVSMGT